MVACFSFELFPIHSLRSGPIVLLSQIAYETFLFLALEAVLLAVLTGILFRLRRRFGLSLLAVFLGSNQYLSVLLATAVFYRAVGNAYVSPGSTVFFSASLFAVLLVYLHEDIPTTRALILAVVLINVVVTLCLGLTAWQMGQLDTLNPLGLPIDFFVVNPKVFLIGTLLLLVDFFLLVLLYEGLRRYRSWLPRGLRTTTALVTVLLFDATAFSIGVFWQDPILKDVLVGQVVGKGFVGLIYGAMLTAYLRLFERTDSAAADAGDTSSLFSILTYRERFEIVSAKLEEERAASLAKNRFLAHMSHELRTPLNAIIGFTSVLLSGAGGDDGESARTYLERVRANGLHLLTLINGLLDLSKIESGTLDFEETDFSVSELVRDTTAQLQGQAVDKRLELVADLPTEEIRLCSDPTKLRQILINLIGNAIKFTDTGGVRVRLSAADDGGANRIEVIDTGVGIPEDQLDRIFKAFSRVDELDSKRYPGTGLGLAISRALCDQMGLELQAASRLGRGSHFTIVLSTDPPIEAGARS